MIQMCKCIKIHIILNMKNIEQIRELTSNKDKRVTLMFNNKLWETFRHQCEKENTKPTPMIENLILKYLDEKGIL